jgi:hypothetical protein
MRGLSFALSRASFATALLVFVQPSLIPRASALTLDDISRGAYDQLGNFGAAGSGTASGNYLTGYEPGGAYYENFVYRSFFTFDLSTVSGRVISAQLDMATVLDPYSSGPGPVTFNLKAYSGNIQALDSDNAGTEGFDSLASGTLLATTDVSPSAVNVNGSLNITLDPAALLAIQNAEGSMFSVGGSLATNFVPDLLFGYSDGAPPTELVLTTSAVPEPAPFTLLAAIASGIGIFSFKSSRKYA